MYCTMSLSTQTDLSGPPLIIEKPAFTIKLYTGSDFAEFIIKSDMHLDEKVARESKKILEETNPGIRYFLLVSSEGLFRLSRKARRLGADKTFSTHLAAVACYTSNYTLSLLGELYNKINKPAVLTRVFSNRAAAKEWLLEQRTEMVQAG